MVDKAIVSVWRQSFSCLFFVEIIYTNLPNMSVFLEYVFMIFFEKKEEKINMLSNDKLHTFVLEVIMSNHQTVESNFVVVDSSAFHVKFVIIMS